MKKNEAICEVSKQKNESNCILQEASKTKTPWFMFVTFRKKKKEHVPKERTKKISNEKFLVVTVLISIIIILLINAVCILTVCYPHFENSETPISPMEMESVLLSSGLSIVGIGISVWAALNIINMLDRKDFYVLKDELEALKDKHRNIVDKSRSDRERQQEHYTENSKKLFIAELLKSSADYSTELIARKMGAISGKEDVPYMELLHVEQLFSRIYRLHGKKPGDEMVNLAASEGIERALSLLENLQENPDALKEIEQYLNYRIGDFHFYMGYCQNLTPEDVKNRFETAIKYYEKSMMLFGAQIPAFDAGMTHPYITSSVFPRDKVISSYMCNAIGEAYSKIIERASGLKKDDATQELIVEYRKKADFYCTHAAAWSEYRNERYLRNWGCALERVYGDDKYLNENASRIMEIYQKALDAWFAKPNDSDKAFYTWLSFNHKLSAHTIKRIKDSANEYWLNCRSKLITAELLMRNNLAIKYSKFASDTYPQKLVYKKFYALALCDRCIWNINVGNQLDNIDHLVGQLEDIIEELRCFYPNEELWDDFMKEINEYVTEIMRYL